MVPAEGPNGLVCDLAPPSGETQLGVRDWLALALQLLWGTLLVIKDIIFAVYSTVFPSPGKSLGGQVVLVTGGGRGLGRGLALGFSREGCKVAVVDVNITNATNTAADIAAAGGVAKAYQCDVAKPGDIRALRQSVTSDLGPVDILVNNAGIIYFGELLEDCLEHDIRAVVEVNLLSHFWMMKEFLPTMKARNSGHIVAIASASAFAGIETASAYVASKFGVRGLMEVVSYELELQTFNNIHTTTVYPYFINTSADYVSRWKLRVPPISIEAAVDATIAGVKKNLISVFIPGSIHFAVKMLGILPPMALMRYKKFMFYDVDRFAKQDHPENDSSTVQKSPKKNK